MPSPLKQKIIRHIGEDRDIFRTLSNIYDEFLFEYSNWYKTATLTLNRYVKYNSYTIFA